MLGLDHHALQRLKKLIMQIPAITEQDASARSGLLLFGLPKTLVHSIEPHYDPEVHVGRIITACVNWGLVGTGSSKQEWAILVLIENLERLIADLPTLKLEFERIQTHFKTLARAPAPGLSVASEVQLEEPLSSLLKTFPYAGTAWQVLYHNRSICLFADLVIQPLSPPSSCLIKIADYKNLQAEYNNYCRIIENGILTGFILSPISSPIPLQGGVAALILPLFHSASSLYVPLQQFIEQDMHKVAVAQLEMLAKAWLEWNPLQTPVPTAFPEALKNACEMEQAREATKMEDLVSDLYKRLFGFSHPKPPSPKPLLRFEGIASPLPNPVAYLYGLGLYQDTKSFPFLAGQVIGNVITRSLVVQIDRSKGAVFHDSTPLLIELGHYVAQGCYLFDWAYLELDILSKFVAVESKNGWEQWIEIVRQVTSMYRILGDYQGEFGGKTKEAFAYIRHLREVMINRFAENDPCILETLVSNFWLAGTAAGLRFALEENRLPEERAASLYYSAMCLANLLPDITYDGQDTQFVPISLASQERLYLNDIMQTHEVWKELHVPLAGEKQTPIRSSPVLSKAARELIDVENMGLSGDVVVQNGQLLSAPVPVERIDETITELGRVVLLGSPGSGKTTTMRWLAYRYAAQALEDQSAPLPIFVPLGGFSANVSLADYFAQNFGLLRPRLNQYLSRSRQRGIVLLLDGLNEMPRNEINQIRRALWRTNFPFVISCRTMDYQNELQDLENLSVVKIRELDPKRIVAFVENYVEENPWRLFERIGGSKELLEATERFEKAGLVTKFWDAVYWSDIPWDYGTTGDAILDTYLELYSNRRQLIWLARNPYMLRMIVEVYNMRFADIPKNRGELFRAFVKTLVTRAYSRREQGTDQIDADLLLAGLGVLAHAMQTSDERTQIEYDSAEMHLKRRFPDKDISLLLRLAERAYFIDTFQFVRFRHQLLQEYFAAQVLREAIDRGQNAEDFWKTDFWWLPTGWEETAILLAGFHESPQKIVEWIQNVNPELARRCIVDSGVVFSESTSDKFVAFLQKFTDDEKRTIQSRAHAGITLGRMKDERPGISVKSTIPSVARTPFTVAKSDLIPNIVWVEIGPVDKFQMGLSEEDVRRLRENLGLSANYDFATEIPAHTQQLAKPFWISRYPVTNAQFVLFAEDETYNNKIWWSEPGIRWRQSHKRFLANDPYNLPNCPAVYVSWYEALAYANWLSTKIKMSIRLPTELEWEVAASYNYTTHEKHLYPWGEKFELGRCNSSELSFPYPSIVTLFPSGSSPTGVLEMIGNIWEWCSTVWQVDCTNPDSRFMYPYRPEDGREKIEYQRALRVVRGGCYLDSAQNIRVTSRMGSYAGVRMGGIGFRLVTDKNPHK